ncbi:serine/threonine-protein kinase [Nocardia tengchongensis]|uniref:serine/threonine-protein kinase n=1 Tax=Nocardia tengchongensis TaxID=2055889 RepID=UPI0036AC3867
MATFTDSNGEVWHYDLDAEIFRRGDVVIYQGRHDPDGRKAAIKVVGSGGSPTRLAMNNREIEIGEKLKRSGVDFSHLLIPYGAGRFEESTYHVMPLAEHDLAAHHHRNDLGVPEIVDILRQIAKGLGSLASAGVQHRDLKPGNILSVNGVWRIADFGISRDIEAGTEGLLTFKGEGTWEYVAPEAFGQAGAASEKSDLYSLGIIAFELLTGAPPFTSDNFIEVMRMQCESPVPELPERVPSALRALVLRLLTKDPDRRPANPAAVLSALDAVLAEATDSADRLHSMALAVAKRDSQRDAARAAEDAKNAEFFKHATQGISDLQAIWADVVERISSQLGAEVESSDRLMAPGVAHLTWSGFELRAEIRNVGKWDAREAPLLVGSVFAREGVGSDFSDSQDAQADILYQLDSDTGQFGWRIRQWLEDGSWVGRDRVDLFMEFVTVANKQAPPVVNGPSVRIQPLASERFIEVFTDFVTRQVE